MPFIGLLDGKRVIPEEVDDGVDVICPECEDRMHPWGPSVDGRARHFQHYAGDRECSTVGGGEDDVHRKMKSIAVSHLKTTFDGNIALCEPEVTLDSLPNSSADHRRADAFVEFEKRDEQLGEGLIIEVQYRNKSKDIEATTDDYLALDYSVVWAYEDDFGNDVCVLDEIDLRNRAFRSAWPDKIPEIDEWQSSKYDYSRLQSRWVRAWLSGLAKSGTPATLPPDWCDQEAQKIWNDQKPSNIFTQKYESTEYIEEVRGSLDPGPQPTVWLPPEWIDQASKEVWRDTDWEELFDNPTSEQLIFNKNYQHEVYVEEVRETLNPPVLEINFWPFIPNELLFKWFYRGKESDDYHDWIPGVIEWGGSYEIDVEKTDPHIEIKLPPEYFESVRDKLRIAWQTGAGVLDVDLAKRLAENNAPRRCAVCSNQADFYLLKRDELSEYRCESCTIELVSNLPTP